MFLAFKFCLPMYYFYFDRQVSQCVLQFVCLSISLSVVLKSVSQSTSLFHVSAIVSVCSEMSLKSGVFCQFFFSNLQIFRGMSKADSRKTRFYLFFVLTVLVFLSFVFCMHLSYYSKHFMLGRWTCGLVASRSKMNSDLYYRSESIGDAIYQKNI